MARTPNYEILELLRDRVNSGRYNSVGFLPSERELSQEFGVGRGVIRNALKTLQQEKLIRVIPQRGACVCPEVQPRRLSRFLVSYRNAGSFRNAWEPMGILSGICAMAAELYAEAIISFTQARQSPVEFIARHHQGDLQGLIFLEQLDDPELAGKLVQAGIPWVIANDEFQSDATASRMDLRGVGRLAGRRLIEAGHRHIGVVAGPLDRPFSRELLAGFRGALAEEEILFDPRLMLGTGDEEFQERLLAMLRSPERPSAIFAMRDNRAERVYQACQLAKLRIPQDISVIGYDDISWPDAARAELTTIRQPVDEIGRAAVELLNTWVLTGEAPPSRIIQGELVERKSVGPPR